MGWLFAFLCATALAVVAWQHRQFLRHWRHLQAIVEDLAEGREPKSFVFLKSGRFIALAGHLERLADAQERLRRRRSQEERNLQAILGSMEEAVMVVDRRHTIRLVNPSFVRLFKLGFDPINQTALQALRHPAFEQIVAATFETGEAQARDVSLDHAKPLRHIAVNAVLMRDAAGADAVVMIFRDVTRLRQLEEVRREFVANVSHELRTPLSIFQGYLENLIDDPELARAGHGEVLAVMRKHSLRLNALLEDLLILARLESRAEILHHEEIALERFLREVAADWRMRSEEKGIALRIEAAPDLPPLVADRMRLEQVFNNLIDNALNYSDPGDTVIVRAVMLGDVIEIRVEDSGIGIPPADLARIFERFYRADKARSRQHGGTGLGLSIVKHIVQTHGGTVDAESVHGTGTTIILRFPREAGPVLPAGASHEAKS
jgi:two-component system phosphate regulon sensor histidine kinase PhoR